MSSQQYIWTVTNPRLKQFLRRAERERNAALGAFLMMPFRLPGRLTLAGYRRVRRFLRRRANRRILASLSNAQLKDIGIARSEIPFAVWALDFERNRARLRARNRLGEDGPHAGARASRERPAEDVEGVADGQESGIVVPLPPRSVPPPERGRQEHPGTPRAVTRAD